LSRTIARKDGALFINNDGPRSSKFMEGLGLHPSGSLGLLSRIAWIRQKFANGDLSNLIFEGFHARSLLSQG
jgi:hypothetical protein